MNKLERAAMQQALEALEIELEAETCDEFAGAAVKCAEAITALREALAEPEDMFIGFDAGLKEAMENDPLYQMGYDAALAEQAEQEPVAWFVQYKNRHEFVFGSKPKYLVDGVVEPLYTAPVSVEAAVLAEREACAKVCEDINNPTFEAVAAAIRARSEK